MEDDDDSEEEEKKKKKKVNGPVLVVKRGAGLGWLSYPLLLGEQTFGRGDANHRLDDQYTSDLHATVKLVAPTGRSKVAKLTIRDEDTTNGTKVNGSKVVKGKYLALKSGDTVKMGATVLEVQGL